MWHELVLKPTLYANPIANQPQGKEKERRKEEANLQKTEQHDFTTGPKVEPLTCKSIPKTHTLTLN